MCTSAVFMDLQNMTGSYYFLKKEAYQCFGSSLPIYILTISTLVKIDGNTTDSTAMRHFFEECNNNIGNVLIPEGYLSLDETLYPMRTQISFKQYNPDKPAKYGMLFKSINNVRYPCTHQSHVYCDIYKRYLHGRKIALSKPVKSLKCFFKKEVWHLIGKALPNSNALPPFSRKLKPKRFKTTYNHNKRQTNFTFMGQ